LRAARDTQATAARAPNDFNHSERFSLGRLAGFSPASCRSRVQQLAIYTEQLHPPVAQPASNNFLLPLQTAGILASCF
jgi:hypothetical protein